ncbi:MAG: prepilin-type N-terminal cleavage/methylation domain-containing protein [Gemmatimonadota bacterium]|nr:prepilin-type N-terminal cleavage/methylation domain-containing protein [Gemmatimonadota bacterium]
MSARRTDNHRNAGFSLIELLTVIMLFSIATSIGVGAVGQAMERGAVRGANRTFATVHARARSHAVQNGVQVKFIADADVDSLWVSAGDSVITAISLVDDLGVDLQSSPARVQICMNARGLSDRLCNSFQAPVDLRFTKGDKTSRTRVRTFGTLTPL